MLLSIYGPKTAFNDLIIQDTFSDTSIVNEYGHSISSLSSVNT